MVKSQDPMVEGVRRILQVGERVELPAGATGADLEALFLAELRNRRERLASLMQLIQEQVRRETAAPAARSRRPHCRTRVLRSRLSR